jgi:hypothetical protein
MKSDDPALKDVVARLWNRLIAVQGEFGDTLKLQKPE